MTFCALESVAEVAVRAATEFDELAVALGAEERAPDWSTTPEHERAIASVVRRINTDADPAIDADDVEQEARLYLAVASESARSLEGGLLVNRVQTNVARRLNIYNRQPFDSLDEILEQAAAEHRASSRDFTSGWLSRPEPPEFEGKSYSPSQVEYVLPALWDEEYGKGIPNPRAPAPGMPSAKTNPKTANTHLAMIADIKAAWAGTDLTVRERRALLLRFGLNWLHDEIAAELGYAGRDGALRACERGVLKMTNHLNGTEDEPEWES